jgi:hypothetical protein
MQHLKAGLTDQLTGFTQDHVRQILSLVLLATSLKAAGQPGGKIGCDVVTIAVHA